MTINSKKIGKILIIAGLLGLFLAVVQSFTPYADLDQGALPAASFLGIMLGMCFYFPTMLEDGNGQVSTMRIIVFAVVMVFCVIYLKIGWSIRNFEVFTIDKTWIYILGLAFGSKVFQKFAEDDSKGKTGTDEEDK